jgi:hypothetical protein
MFWFRGKKFVGSNFVFSSTSRACFAVAMDDPLVVDSHQAVGDVDGRRTASCTEKGSSSCPLRRIRSSRVPRSAYSITV